MTQVKIIYWEQTNTQTPQRKKEYHWGPINLHANNNVINPDMMEDLPSSKEEEGIMEDADATTEVSAVEVQAGENRTLYQPSAKKGALHVPIAMEKLIASTMEKKATGQTYLLLLEEQHLLGLQRKRRNHDGNGMWSYIQLLPENKSEHYEFN